MKSIISLGVVLAFTGCAAPVNSRVSSDNSQEVLRRKTVHSPYIATARPREVHPSYPKLGEYRNYGTVEAQPAPIASGPADVAPEPSDYTPTGARRTVINQVTNEPVR